MLGPREIRQVLADAARLARHGELIVFGSASLAFWLENPPRTRDVDIFCLPAERGDAIEAMMGELSAYHERHGAYVEVWTRETFRTCQDWRKRAKELQADEAPELRILVPHPHDVVVAKLERCDERDRDQIKKILREFPLRPAELEDRLASSAHESGEIQDSERIERFRHWADWLRELVRPA